MSQDPFDQEGITATATPAPPPTLQEFVSLVNTKNLARQERFYVNFGTLQNYEEELSLLCEEAAIPGKQIQTKTLRINGLDEHRAQTATYGDEIVLQFLIDSDFTPRKVMEAWMSSIVGDPMGKRGENGYKGREVGFYEEYAKDIGIHALVVGGFPGEKFASYSPTQADTGLNEALKDFKNTAPIGVSTTLNNIMNRGARTVDRLAAKARSQTIGRLNLASSPLLDITRNPETVVYTILLKEAFPVSINVMPLSFANPGVQRMNVTFRYKYWQSTMANGSSLEENILNSFNNAISKEIKSITNKIPGESLGNLGRDLSDKFGSFTNRFGS